MKRVLRVREVFQVAGRTILAADEENLDLRFGDRLRSEDGTEIVVKSVAFSSAEAWLRGRRGVHVDVISGNVSTGQVFVPVLQE